MVIAVRLKYGQFSAVNRGLRVHLPVEVPGPALRGPAQASGGPECLIVGGLIPEVHQILKSTYLGALRSPSHSPTWYNGTPQMRVFSPSYA